MEEAGLVGRSAELARLTALLDAAEAGLGGALLVEGAAGIGKSALLRAIVDAAAAADVRLLAVTGVPAGGGTGFGALHELLHPILDGVARLPQRQATALEVALGLVDGPTPDPLVLGTAVLGLLEQVAERTPLLLVVDDLHWCDASSAEVVAFLATRLGGTRIALVAARRDDERAAQVGAAFIDRLRLEPLSRSAAEALVDRTGGLGAHRDRVLAHAEGNPLALVELAAQAAGTADDAHRARMAVPRRVEAAFLAEARSLPEPARRALLLAAVGVNDLGTEVVRAGERLRIPAEGFAEVERAGLLRRPAGDARFRFRHPLVVSALLDAAGPLGVLAEHRALAEVVEDPGRRAWHRADGAPGWDDEIAAELDLVADRALRRGARDEATRAAERAAGLTRDPAARGRRLALAAETARQAGLPDDAVRLLDAARRLEPDPGTAKDLASVEWLLTLTAGVPSRGVPRFLRLADELPDGEGRAEVLMWAAVLCYLLPQPEDLRRLVRDELRRTADSPWTAIGLALVGDDVSAERIRELAARSAGAGPIGAVVLNCLAFVAEDRAELELALDCWGAAVRIHAEAGRPGDEATAMAGRGTVRLIAGDLRGAQEDLELAMRLSAELGLVVVEAICAASLACVAVGHGATDRSREMLARVDALSGRALSARVAAVAAWAEALIAAAAHDYASAADALLRTEANPPIAFWAKPDLAVAVVRAGRQDDVRRWIDDARPRVAATGSPRLRMLLLRSEAVIDRERSVALLTEAIVAGDLAGDAGGVARIRLLLGEELRRERRLLDAREQLAAALEVLRELGLTPWAERAELELRAAGGEVADEQRGSVTERLTAQELHVGRLAAVGLTNREIADRLYLSHSTVNAHLRSTFTKLGVERRGQLASLLDAR